MISYIEDSRSGRGHTLILLCYPYLNLQCLVPQSATQPCNIQFALSLPKKQFLQEISQCAVSDLSEKEVGFFITGRLGYILNDKLCFWSGSRRVHCKHSLCGSIYKVSYVVSANKRKRRNATCSSPPSQYRFVSLMHTPSTFNSPFSLPL